MKKKKKKGKKGPWITLGIVGAIIALIISVSSGNGGSSDGEPKAKPAAEAPATVDEVPAAPAEEVPALTLAQQNAVDSAQSYLDMSGFSRSGLIGQLEYEGYTTEEATFAVDHIAPDWNAEAADSAQSYLEVSSFSRDGLLEQLLFEGYSQAEAEAGLAAVGY